MRTGQEPLKPLGSGVLPCSNKHPNAVQLNLRHLATEARTMVTKRRVGLV